ncbi:AMP-binding protein, partial [Streptomyces hygroscopicus]|uniref:AMP-binding protein n=1 Tax=Streptomyces hygroscopicus TaxID=1912 RepID=UPI003684B094
MAAGMRELLEALFDAHPGELPYLVHGEHPVSRAEVRDAVAREADVFAGHGVGEGRTVMLRIPPSFTQIEVLFALWRLGAQVMLVDHRLKPSEVDALRSVCHPQFMVSAGTAGRSPLRFEPRYEVVTSRCPGGRAAATAHRLVQFSSGSTGLPKVIGRTADSLAAEIDRFTRIEGMPAPGERVLLLSSTAHSFGLIAGVLHTLAVGVSAVFARRVSARDILAAAGRHDVHLIFGTPFHYELLGTARELPALPAQNGRNGGSGASGWDEPETAGARRGPGT